MFKGTQDHTKLITYISNKKWTNNKISGILTSFKYLIILIFLIRKLYISLHKITL